MIKFLKRIEDIEKNKNIEETSIDELKCLN